MNNENNNAEQLTTQNAIDVLRCDYGMNKCDGCSYNNFESCSKISTKSAIEKICLELKKAGLVK